MGTAGGITLPVVATAPGWLTLPAVSAGGAPGTGSILTTAGGAAVRGLAEPAAGLAGGAAVRGLAEPAAGLAGGAAVRGLAEPAAGLAGGAAGKALDGPGTAAGPLLTAPGEAGSFSPMETSGCGSSFSFRALTQ